MLFLASVCGVATQSASALSFLSFDPRSMAMGGTGVVSSKPESATLFNPALLVPEEASQRTWHSQAYAGVRLLDRDNFLDKIDAFEDNLSEQALDARLLDARSLFRNGVLTVEDARGLSSAGRRLLNEVNDLGDKPLRAAASIGITAGQSRNNWAVGIYHRRYLVLGGQIRLASVDIDRMTQLVDTVDAFANVMDGISTLRDLAEALEIDEIERQIEEAIAAGRITDELRSAEDIPGIQEFIEQSLQVGQLVTDLEEFLNLEELVTALIEGGTSGSDLDLDLRDYLRYQIPERIESSVEMQGAEVSETSVNLALRVDALPGMRIGANLKHVDFTTIHYTIPIGDFEFSDYRNAEHRRSARDLNLDIGAHYQWSTAWSTGLVARNVISRRYKTALNEVIEVDPMVRVAMGYRRDRLLLAADLDLTSNEALGFDPDKRYLGLGMEWYARKFLALRAGLRRDLESSEYLPSLGFGLEASRWRLDAAVARAPRNQEWGLGLMFAVRW